MPRTKKTPAPAPAVVAHLPSPPAVWISPDGYIVVQRGSGWRPEKSDADARYIVSAVVNDRAWAIAEDRQSVNGRPHTATSIRALAKAIAERVAADPSHVRAMENDLTDKGKAPGGSPAAFRNQIADLLDRRR